MKRPSPHLKNMTAVSVGVAVILTSTRWPKVFTSTRCRAEAGDHIAKEHARMSERIVAYRLDGPPFFVTP